MRDIIFYSFDKKLMFDWYMCNHVIVNHSSANFRSGTNINHHMTHMIKALGRPWLMRVTSFNNNRTRTRSYTNVKKGRHVLQYVSDLHVDMKPEGYVPDIKVDSDKLVICGDIGIPTHTNFELLFENVSKKFERVYFVPGNHDYDSGPLFESKKYNKYSPIIEYFCNKHKNIYCLDNKTVDIDDTYTLAGSTLWSRPVLDWSKHNYFDKYHRHLKEHENSVRWIQDVIAKTDGDKKLIIATHFVPSYALIENKYRTGGKTRSSWFYTELEFMINMPVHAWICGHTHSRLSMYINNIYCGVNAYESTHNKSAVVME